MDIQRVLALADGDTEENRLGMILSNRIDHGSAEGGLISSKKFPQLVQDLKAWNAQTALTWYHWTTDVGEIFACAATPDKAREQVMLTLSANDAARSEVEAAISPEPQVLKNEPRAIVVWHQ